MIQKTLLRILFVLIALWGFAAFAEKITAKEARRLTAHSYNSVKISAAEKKIKEQAMLGFDSYNFASGCEELAPLEPLGFRLKASGCGLENCNCTVGW